jgi:hypothetical protein
MTRSVINTIAPGSNPSLTPTREGRPWIRRPREGASWNLPRPRSLGLITLGEAAPALGVYATTCAGGSCIARICLGSTCACSTGCLTKRRLSRGFEAIARERGFLTNVFEEVIGASPVVMESLRRAADGQDTDHPLLREDAGDRSADA